MSIQDKEKENTSNVEFIKTQHAKQVLELKKTCKDQLELISSQKSELDTLKDEYKSKMEDLQNQKSCLESTNQSQTAQLQRDLNASIKEKVELEALNQELTDKSLKLESFIEKLRAKNERLIEKIKVLKDSSSQPIQECIEEKEKEIEQIVETAKDALVKQKQQEEINESVSIPIIEKPSKSNIQSKKKNSKTLKSIQQVDSSDEPKILEKKKRSKKRESTSVDESELVKADISLPIIHEDEEVASFDQNVVETSKKRDVDVTETSSTVVETETKTKKKRRLTSTKKSVQESKEDDSTCIPVKVYF